MKTNSGVTKVTSKKYRWNWQDALRSALTSLYAAVVASFGQVLEPWLDNPSGPFPFNKISVALTIKIALAAFLGEMYRRWVKPSQTVVTIKPPVGAAKDAAKNIITILLAVAASLMLLCSCNTSKIHKTISKSDTDSLASSSKDSSGLSKKEKSTTDKKDSTGKKESVNVSGVEIEFDDDDIVEPTGPIIIVTKDDTTTIDPGGRKVKGAKTNQSRSTKDSSGTSKSSTSTSSKSDSSHKAENTNINLHKETKAVAIDKDKRRFPIGAIIGIVALLGFCIFLYWFIGPRKKQKEETNA